MTNQENTAAIRTQITRVFEAFGRDATKTQLTEWERVASKYRIDWVVRAVDQLIENMGRFPTISDFKTALMEAKYRHESAGKAMTEKSDFTRRQERQEEAEKVAYYRDLFGNHATATRSLIQATCSQAVRPLRASKGFADIISAFSDSMDYKERYELIREYSRTITIGRPTREQVSDIVGF